MHRFAGKATIFCCLIVAGSFYGSAAFSQTDQPLIIKGKKPDVDIVVQEIDTITQLQLSNVDVSWSFATPYSNANAQLIDYLGNSSIRKQLEFTDSQNKQFEQLNKEFRQAYSQLYKDYPELKDKNLPKEARKVLNRKVQLAGKKLREEFSEKVEETLIPRQVSLVKTLKFKQMVQMFGFGHAISKSSFGKDMKVTDEQKKEIAKIQQDSQKAIQKKIEEMKAEAKKEMLKVLTSKQRKQLKEIQGDEDN